MIITLMDVNDNQKNCNFDKSIIRTIAITALITTPPNPTTQHITQPHISHHPTTRYPNSHQHTVIVTWSYRGRDPVLQRDRKQLHTHLALSDRTVPELYVLDPEGFKYSDKIANSMWARKFLDLATKQNKHAKNDINQHNQNG